MPKPKSIIEELESLAPGKRGSGSFRSGLPPEAQAEFDAIIEWLRSKPTGARPRHSEVLEVMERRCGSACSKHTLGRYINGECRTGT